MKYFIICCLFLALFGCGRKVVTEQVIDGNLLLDTAYVYMEEGKLDSAFLYFDKGKQLYIERNDSLGVARSLINMAIIQRGQSDFYGAQESALLAEGYLKLDEPEHHAYLSSNYNILAIATDKLKDYEQAIAFYKLAIKFSTDSTHKQVYYNNIALSHQSLGQYDLALAIYEHILAESTERSIQYARFLTNKAKTRWQMDQTYNPVPEFLEALGIRTHENDNWGQNSSYGQLADYYKLSKPDSALFYAKLQYQIAKSLNSADDQINGLQRLIHLSPAADMKGYFESYKILNDSIQSSRAAAKNQFALIRYEVEKNKADNLTLQRDNAEKAYRLTWQRIWTFSISGFTLIGFSFAILWYKKRKERNERESQFKIKAEQLRISRKVHDVVANGIYRVMTEIEHKESLDRDGVLDRLEDMYNQSRDISYEAEDGIKPTPFYHMRMASLLKSFATQSCRILIAGNEKALWNGVAEAKKKEIFAILQELMVNMRKHSHADQVVIRFERAGDGLWIHYRDNGLGLADGWTEGNGLKSTGNRIESLFGKINFVNKPEKGLRIEVFLPLP